MGSKKDLIIIIISALCVFSFPRAEEKEGPKIELVPVYEKTFDDTIVDVIFDTATVSIEEAKKMGWKENAFSDREKTEGVAKINYPKVIFIGNSHPLDPKVTKVKFYSRFGNVKTIISIDNRENVYKSPKGEYILIGKWPDDSNSKKQGGKLYDANGDLLREYKDYFPIAVSDDGHVIAGELSYETEAPGDFIFYDPLGTEVGRVHNPLKDEASGWCWAIFTDDGKFALMGYTETTSRTAIIYTTNRGKIIWTHLIDYASFFPYASIVCTDYIGGAGYKYSAMDAKFIGYCIYLINRKNGKLKWLTEIEKGSNFDFGIGRAREKLYISSTFGGIWCIETNNGKILWQHKESWFSEKIKGPELDKTPSFYELRIIDDTLYIIRKNGETWRSSTLFILEGEKGEILNKIEYSHEKIAFAKTEEMIGLINLTKKKIVILRKGALK